jgi:hypothetical protein
MSLADASDPGNCLSGADMCVVLQSKTIDEHPLCWLGFEEDCIITSCQEGMDMSRAACLTLNTDTTDRSYSHVGPAERRRQRQSDYTFRNQSFMRKGKGTTSLDWILFSIKKNSVRNYLTWSFLDVCQGRYLGSGAFQRTQQWSIEFLASLSRISRPRLDCPLTPTVQTGFERRRRLRG